MNVGGCAFSNHGSRGENEDRVLAALHVENAVCAAIADGMGGSAGGAIASEAAIATIENLMHREPELDFASLFAAVKVRLKEIGNARPDVARMGTTLSVLRLVTGHGEVGHVGDTRVYHLRANGIMNRALDQTELQKLIDEGVLSKIQAKKYPRRNILLSAISSTSDYDLYKNNFEVLAGDRFVLCSDGLYSKVFKQEIRDLSLLNRDVSDFCKALQELARSRVPTDDYSAVCLQIDD